MSDLERLLESAAADVRGSVRKETSSSSSPRSKCSTASVFRPMEKQPTGPRLPATVEWAPRSLRGAYRAEAGEAVEATHDRGPLCLPNLIRET